ncbi:hypothetical protein [Magnetospira sp. QH-2]|uniref:hypothetical protein n=1 Tax=Magnetospira sp. (strain QH-2) TaxID=1288970 RepID=UPI0003E80F90|nr:hypothetical protein [Magnetospira sp. QH-2]CCQ75668.1 protein of unknown function [Magnetospira sp. QH-2]
MAPLKPEEIQAIRDKPVAERTHADQRRLHWAEDYWTNEEIQTETTAFYKLNSEVGAPTGHATGYAPFGADGARSEDTRINRQRANDVIKRLGPDADPDHVRLVEAHYGVGEPAQAISMDEQGNWYDAQGNLIDQNTGNDSMHNARTLEYVPGRDNAPPIDLLYRPGEDSGTGMPMDTNGGKGDSGDTSTTSPPNTHKPAMNEYGRWTYPDGSPAPDPDHNPLIKKAQYVPTADGVAAGNAASSNGVITVTPGKGTGAGDALAKGAEKVAPKVLGRAGGAIGGAVIPDNEGRQTHDVQVGGQDLSFDHGPGDLYNPVYGKDPATGERVDTGMVAVPNGRDADGNPRFDLMPQSNLGKYLDGKMARTDMADPMPPAPGLEPTPMPEGHGIETYPARQPEKDDGTNVYPDQSEQSGPTAHVNPDQSDELEQMMIVEMGRKDDLKQMDARAKALGMERKLFGKRLHAIKGSMKGDVEVKDNGDVIDDETGEYIGNVFDEY